jgi:aspartyl-tRNA(Asn)/glutamyl-tRNA(Gln) amidotransferase subunit B
MRARFVATYALPAHDAAALTADRETAGYFEAAVESLGGDPHKAGKLVANWMLGELAAALNRDGRTIARRRSTPTACARCCGESPTARISGKMAKEVFDAMWAGERGGDADAIIAANGLQQISDAGAIDKVVDDVLAANAAIVAEFRAGKEKAFQSLVGKAMAATKGKADPTRSMPR